MCLVVMARAQADIHASMISQAGPLQQLSKSFNSGSDAAPTSRFKQAERVPQLLLVRSSADVDLIAQNQKRDVREAFYR